MFSLVLLTMVGMTHALGVGIGRLVFQALNMVEALMAVVIVGAWTQRQDLVSLPAGIFLGMAMMALALQMLVLRPAMSKRTKALSNTALTHGGGTAVRAKVGTLTHTAYIGAEVIKALVLPVAGILLVLSVAG